MKKRPKKLLKFKPCPIVPEGRIYLLTYNPCSKCDLDILFKDKEFCKFKNLFEEIIE